MVFYYSINSAFKPWKEYGLVRGLYAPPLKNFILFLARNSEMVEICSLFSTAHGPAIINKSLPMIVP